MKKPAKAAESKALEKTNPVRADDFHAHYINHVRGGMTEWDIQLTVGRLDEREFGKTTPLESAQLIMSPQFAKAMALNLMEIIRIYEARFGQIPLPIGLVQVQK